MKNNKKRAELALLISLPQTIKGITKPGRLRNLVSEIAKEAERIYNTTFEQASKGEVAQIGLCLEKFNNEIKWSERPRHILSYVSAISFFIEGRGYKKINKLVTEIVDYYERVGKAPAACFWSGVDAKKMWDENFD